MPVGFGVVFVDVVGIGAVGIDDPAGGRRNQIVSNIGLSDGVDFRGINNSLCGQRRIGLKEWVTLEKCDHVGVGFSGRRRVAEIAIELRRGEGAKHRTDERAVLPLPLVAEEKEQAVLSVIDMGNGDWAADGGSELISLEDRARLNVLGIAFVEEGVGVERVIAEVVIKRAVILVCAGLHDLKDDAATTAAVF